MSFQIQETYICTALWLDFFLSSRMAKKGLLTTTASWWELGMGFNLVNSHWNFHSVGAILTLEIQS